MSATTHPEEVTVRDLFEAMADPGGAKFLRFLSAWSVWTVHGVGPFTGEFVGIDEIYGYWRSLMSRTAGTLTFDVDSISGDDERVAVDLTIRAERGHLRLDTPQMAELAIKGGRVEHAWFVLEHPEVFDEFLTADVSAPSGHRVRRTFSR